MAISRGVWARQWETVATIQRSSYLFGGAAVATRISGDPVPANNGLFYLHTDHLGSTNLLTNNSGQQVGDTTRYYPFGGYRTEPSTEAITDRGFTGYKQNDGLGLIYMQARYYVPSVGRFASADTIVPDAERPQQLNRFSYSLNNPINYTDPSGHWVYDDPDMYSELPQVTEPPVQPLPPSYVQITITLRSTGGQRKFAERGVGTAIDSNAILTHNHFLPPGISGADLDSIMITDIQGKILLDTTDFLIATGSELGNMHGGLSLLVFQNDFIADGSAESLGTATGVQGEDALQAVHESTQPGLYRTSVVEDNKSVINPNKVEYSALVVSPDLTTPGDSGSPLFIGGVVRGVNNSGNGIYGRISDIGLIRAVIREMTKQFE